MNLIDILLFMKQMFGWRMVLDILFIASLMFFTYRTLLYLGTWKIVAGILLALVVFLIASIMDLKGMEWIFSNVSHVAVIGLIVIFQPELRRFLERAASIRRANIGDQAEELSVIISEAMTELARQRRGAILVLPGRESINEWMSGGFIIDAAPSFPLIMSIFDPNSPGHDGAMIIDNGRISSFGIRLPVSQNARLSNNYGTRHHAAMGLSEKSDSLIIVVSEERGKLSTFQNGTIQKIEDHGQVTKTILSHWQKITSGPFRIWKRRRSRKQFIPQMLVSIAFAVMFWATIIASRSEILEKIMTVPVEYMASSPTLMMVGEKVSEVRLHVEGPKSNLDSITHSQLSVKIDLSKAVAGKQSFIITDQDISLPKDVSLLDVTPPNLNITLSEIFEQEIPVKPQLVGKLPGGLKLSSVVVSPEKVKVLSPVTSGKEKITNVSTMPIYLESIHEDTRIFCKIVAPPTVQPVDRRWPDVEVIIAVREERSNNP